MKEFPVPRPRFDVDQAALDLFSSEGAPAPADPSSEWLTVRTRRRAIQAILEARFSLAAFEVVRRHNPAYWVSARNDAARVTYDEAMREKQRLSRVADEQLVAEAVAVGFLLSAPQPRTEESP